MTVVKLPTMATSCYTVRQAGRFWDMVLVTPAPSRNLSTALRRYADREAAVADAKATAEAMQRPFKGRAA